MYSREDDEVKEYIKGGCRGSKPESLGNESDATLNNFAKNPSYGYMPDSLSNVQNRSYWEKDLDSSSDYSFGGGGSSSSSGEFEPTPSISDGAAMAIVAFGVGVMTLIVNPGILTTVIAYKGVVMFGGGTALSSFASGKIAWMLYKIKKNKKLSDSKKNPKKRVQ